MNTCVQVFVRSRLTLLVKIYLREGMLSLHCILFFTALITVAILHLHVCDNSVTVNRFYLTLRTIGAGIISVFPHNCVPSA